MTDEEFTGFAKCLFVAFPDIWEWLQANSPDPWATQAVWRGVLRPYSLEDCVLVMDGWLTGKRPMFKHYEKAQIAMVIRQSIEFDRDKQRQREHSNGQSLEYKKTRREDYRPIAQDVPSLGALLREGQALGLSLREGKITQAEFDESKKRLLARVK